MHTVRALRQAQLSCLASVLSVAFCLAVTSRAAASETIQYNLSSAAFSASNPVGQLAQSGSLFYGASYYGFDGNGALFSMTTAGLYKTIHQFTGYNSTTPSASDGANPSSGPLVVNGNLYGTTSMGGTNNLGTIYEYNLHTSTLSILRSFTGYNSGNPGASDGATPYGALVYDSVDGFLYGATSLGGNQNQGTVFKITPGGTGYQIIHNFFGSGAGETDSVYSPGAALCLDGSGTLWGTAPTSVPGDSTGIYNLSRDGSTFNFVSGFSASYPSGYNANSDLILASDGNLYGICQNGGQYNFGTVFQVVTGTGAVNTIYNFDGYVGAYPGGSGSEYTPYPQSRLYQGKTDHNLYGVTSQGGAYGWGTAYKLTLAGAASRLSSFNYQDGAGAPNPPLQSGTSLYLTSFFGGLTAGTEQDLGFGAGISISSAGALKVIQNFGVRGGYYTWGGLTQVGVNYYGVLQVGGAYGDGVVFEISSTGMFTVIHNFNNLIGEGSGPLGNLLLGSDGNLYGTTLYGGAYNYGTIFKMSKTGALTKLHDFFGPTEGDAPTDALSQGIGTDKSNLYGCTSQGGPSGGSGTGGAVFKIGMNGKGFQVLWAFSTAGSNPNTPVCNVVPDGKGNLWGTCIYAGTGGCLFELSTSGGNFRDAYDFTSPTGVFPDADYLVLVGSVLYGTLDYGGAHGDGVIFSYDTAGSGAYTDLYDFNNGNAIPDGDTPDGGVLYSSSNNALYGSTVSGGANGGGTIWSYNLGTQAFTVLHAFAGSPTDGLGAAQPLILGADGLLHGATSAGGLYNDGVIFTQTLTP